MRYKMIQGTDLKPSCICLGTAEMGTEIEKREAFRMLDLFVERGGNFLDTAHVYANWIPGETSVSEKTLGQWIKERKNRNRIILATKGGHPELSAMHIPRLSKKEIAKDLDESLDNLGVEQIDIFWLHRDDPCRPVEEIIDALVDEQKKGKFRYYGLSNWRLHRLQAVVDYTSKSKLPCFVASQILWSLAEPNRETIGDKTLAVMDRDTWEFHNQSQIAVTPYTAQARGFFSKMHKNGESSLKDWVRATYYSETNIARMQRVVETAEVLEASVGAVVLAYLTSQPFTTIPIIGSQSVAHLAESLEASDIRLEPSQVTYLENGK